MRILLDTHFILWWLGESKELGKTARAIIAEPSNLVFYSAASVWELRIKQQLGKVTLPDNFALALSQQAFEPLAISVIHTHAVAALPMFHKDPFDRMLIAQAKTEGFTLMTRDEQISRYDVELLNA